MVIELDGGQHCENNDDAERTRIIESNGFIVLRYWNNDVLKNMEGVLRDIEHHLHLTNQIPP